MTSLEETVQEARQFEGEADMGSILRDLQVISVGEVVEETESVNGKTRYKTVYGVYHSGGTTLRINYTKPSLSIEATGRKTQVGRVLNIVANAFRV